MHLEVCYVSTGRGSRIGAALCPPFFQGVFSAEAFVKFERYISGLIVPLSTILFSIALHKTIAYSSSNLYNKPIK